MADTNNETTREECLVKVGRSGSKTHRGYVEYRIENAGQPWARKRIVAVGSYCPAHGGVGRMHNRGFTPFPGHDHSKATCEHCKS